MQDEIIKHSRKAYKEMKNTSHSFWHKMKEILIEIGIIVFAVSLSIWLHGKSEHSHQQKEVCDFMMDLKDDLQADVKSMQAAKEVLMKNRSNIAMIEQLNRHKLDSLVRHNADFGFKASIGTTKINGGNYEGFKSSGKIGYIEDKKLKKDILKYYQEATPSILEAEKINAALILKATDYWIDHSNQDIKEIVLSNKFKGMLGMYQNTSIGSLALYDEAISNANRIIEAIDYSYIQH